MSAKTAQGPTAEKAAAVRPAASVLVQRLATRVSSPKDPAEKEAEATAKKVMRMAAPQSPYISRFADTGVFARQRESDAQPRVTGSVAAEIQSSMAGGSPLPSGVRGFMEPRFRADFSNVKVHTGEKAARLSAGLQAQAFTVGSHVFFGRDRFRPESSEGRELIAHELTHTIQQGGAIQRSEDVSVAQQSPAQVQRLSLSSVADRLADWANAIPGFRMFTIVIGVNPINMSRADRSPANILRAVVEFLPGGFLITQVLDRYDVFDRVGNWVEQQIRTLGITGDSIRRAISEFVDSLGLSDLLNLGGVFSRARRIFTDPIDRIIAFARNLFAGILRFIREAILRPLANLASRTPAWDLLKAVLGQDPITGDPYPRNADTLIGGFMKLIGQEEVWNNLKRANAVARAWAWFQGALNELIGFVREIPTLFVQALEALQIQDLADLPGAFARVGRVFTGFVGRFLSWGLSKVLSLLEIIFEVVAPSVVPYLRRAAGAFRTIIQNPIGFIGNLVRAGLQGFRQFAANFLTHLRGSLIAWLTGAMSGANIYIPQAFTLREMIKFVLSVLGLTWQNIRQKLVRAVGETAVRALETGFDIVMTLVTQGPAAAWEKIQESLSNLREMVMEQIMTFVRDRVVQAAITRLVTSLNPAGAFIQAIIAIYNTIMFFVERLRQIAQVAASFIDSISAIASGVISAGANRVEQTMAGLLTLVISFLARIAGLGRVSDAVINIVNRVRAPIDRALDRVVDWIVAQARRLGRLVANVGGRVATWWRLRRAFQSGGESHTLFFRGEGPNARLFVASHEIGLDVLLQAGGPLERGVTAAGAPGPLTALPRARAENDHVKAAQVILAQRPSDEVAARELTRSFNALAEQLVILGVGIVAASDLPDTVIRNSPNGGKAGSVTAAPLSNRGSGGSAPDRNIVGWAHVLTIDSNNWERTHLVSEQFYGPGRPWNIIPARRTDNQWMRRLPENSVKTIINNNGVVYYHVEIGGYHDLQHPTGGAAIEGFPRSITVTISTMRKEGAGWVRAVSLGVFSKSLEPPQLVGGNRLDLKTANALALRGIGVPRGIAENIFRIKGPGGSFRDEQDFRSRLESYYANIGNPAYRKNQQQFAADIWPVFEELIRSGRATF